MPAITFETADGTERIEREHVNTNDGWVIAINVDDSGNVRFKTRIPRERVVRIDE